MSLIMLVVGSGIVLINFFGVSVRKIRGYGSIEPGRSSQSAMVV